MQNILNNATQDTFVSSEKFTNWFKKYTNFLTTSYSFTNELAETILAMGTLAYAKQDNHLSCEQLGEVSPIIESSIHYIDLNYSAFFTVATKSLDQIVEQWKSNAVKNNLSQNAALLRALIAAKDKFTPGQLYDFCLKVGISPTGSLLNPNSQAGQWLANERGAIDASHFFEQEDQHIKKAMHSVFNVEELFQTVMGEVDAIGYLKYQQITKKYNDEAAFNAKKVIKDQYYNNRWKDYKAMANTCKDLRKAFFKNLGIHKNPSVLDRKDLGQMRHTVFIWEKNKHISTNIDENFLILQANGDQAGQTCLFNCPGNPEILRELIRTGGSHKSQFIFKDIINEIPDFLPIPEEQTNYQFLKNTVLPVSTGTAIAKAMKKRNGIEKFNQQLKLDCFNEGQGEKIIELSLDIQNGNQHFKGMIYTCSLSNAINLVDGMRQGEFKLPSFIKGCTSITEAAKRSVPFKYGDQINGPTHNVIFEIDSTEANGVKMYGRNECLIDCYSNFRFTDSRLTSSGVVVSLKLLPKENPIQATNWGGSTSWAQFVDKRGMKVRIRECSSEGLAKKIMDLIEACGRYSTPVNQISFQPKNAYIQLLPLYLAIKQKINKNSANPAEQPENFSLLPQELINEIFKNAILSIEDKK